MKKTIMAALLVLFIVTAAVAGTLANYTTTIEDLASGSVVGKEFIFLAAGQDTFEHNVKIAPTETVAWQFGVRNYNDSNVITETDLYYALTFDVIATPGKSAIDPLIVTVKDEQGNVIDSVTGTGKLKVTGQFPLDAQGQRRGYTVELYWPSNDDIDINYAGGAYSTTVNVSAAASQVAFSSDPEDADPKDPADPQEGDITVEFKRISDTWRDNNGTGPLKYNFQAFITNQSGETINGWMIRFTLNGQLVSVYDADIAESSGTSYALADRNWNKTIQPGETRMFGGQVVQPTLEGISGVTVNGAAAQLINTGF